VLTEEALGLMLSTGEEVAGFEAGGLWVGDFPKHAEPKLPTDLWAAGASSESWRMHGPGWIATLWRIQLDTWPVSSEWRGLVEATLSRLATRGAAIAWVANDHTFADPPDLFDPNVMGDMIVAALSNATGFVCSAGLGKPVEWLPPAIQDTLRAEAVRLIDLSLPDPDEGQ
jgi:hypothetical protein